ncbi:MAG: zinc ribbon domain-containing protein [Dehalococcoidia bacterium]|nr:zinc ribbon domain-containing protein [Dehalococcoidia bacterium]
MPIYEYRCQTCAKLSSFFVRSIGSTLEPVCSHCQSNDMERRMSSFATGKTVGSVHENFSSVSEHRSPGYYNDPRNIGRGVEDAFTKFGRDMPQTMRENIDAARSGETPKGMDL